ncbi:MAG: septum formation inhibitor Maf [Woeseiaceae bacterium]|nr:septum formation inhibitor Maf [Woeseiaceae bacterium]NIP21593.1 septum formation inhibitor Maf [Woeseiaceae bacterium]NIS90567.1 septum formation inhibitor Maf [Woeseiaceae bacterium]
MENKPLHLASASPRRQEILTALGLNFSAGGADVDERRLGDEPPGDMVLRLARDKALAGAPETGGVVLAADTAVVLGNDVFGKPRDEADALDMLAQLSACTHEVLTGVAVWDGREMRSVLSATEVRFREIDPDEARAYWQSGEPGDKAGAYAIQGKGGVFVEEINGSYSGVVGLPVFETVKLLQQAGIRVL